MVNWKKQQAECKKCNGFGYVTSELMHASGGPYPAWIAKCECQPSNLEEMQEAILQDSIILVTNRVKIS